MHNLFQMCAPCSELPFNISTMRRVDQRSCMYKNSCPSYTMILLQEIQKNWPRRVRHSVVEIQIRHEIQETPDLTISKPSQNRRKKGSVSNPLKTHPDPTDISYQQYRMNINLIRNFRVVSTGSNKSWNAGNLFFIEIIHCSFVFPTLHIRSSY